MARAVARDRSVTSEATFRARCVRDWYGNAASSEAPGSASGQWQDRRWHQLVEVAGTTGWPDLYWAKPDTGTTDTSGWIEFKVQATGAFERVTIPWKPAQPPVLRGLAAHQLHAGMLAWINPRRAWLWVPAQRAVRWAMMVQGPNGFLPWPHTWGYGRVPPPWQLPSPRRLTPRAGDRFSPDVTYMVDGALVTPKQFDKAAPIGFSWAALRAHEGR